MGKNYDKNKSKTDRQIHGRPTSEPAERAGEYADIYAALNYFPEAIKDWDYKKWDDYLLSIQPLDMDARIIKGGITPLVIIFERVYFSKDRLPDNFEAAIERLANREVELNDVPAGFESYNPSTEELKLMVDISVQLARQPNKMDAHQLIKKIEASIVQYPRNPEFSQQLYDCYMELDDESLQAQVAKRNYEKFPDSILALSCYLNDLVMSGDESSMTDLLAGRYLLEDFFPGRRSFNFRDYINYYYILFNYLMSSAKLDAGLLLHHALVCLPEFQKSESDQGEKWHVPFMFPAGAVATTIDSYIADDATRKKLIEQLLDT